MIIIDLLKLFENTCHKYCEHNNKRTLMFDFDDERETSISFHVDVGFALFTDRNWKIGNNYPDTPKGKTDPDVFNTLRIAFETGTLNIIELEKHIISIT